MTYFEYRRLYSKFASIGPLMILLQQNKDLVVKKGENRGPLMILLSRDIENIPLRQMLTTLFTSFGALSLMTFLLSFLVLVFIWKSDDVGGKSFSETSKSVHGKVFYRSMVTTGDPVGQRDVPVSHFTG
jgi:hypothetical protein